MGTLSSRTSTDGCLTAVPPRAREDDRLSEKQILLDKVGEETGTKVNGFLSTFTAGRFPNESVATSVKVVEAVVQDNCEKCVLLDHNGNKDQLEIGRREIGSAVGAYLLY